MTTRMQQLGAFVQSAPAALARLDAFASVGGRYLVVLVAQLGYPDDHDPACVTNLQWLRTLQSHAAQAGIATGGWFNGWAGGELGTTAVQDADQVASIVREYNLGPVCLDLEYAYQQHPQELPLLVSEVRKRLATRTVFVSTNSPNDSMIWNGGNLGHQASMRALTVQMSPQWYSSPAYGGCWFQPDCTMGWLVKHGAEDNFHDPSYPGGRAVPLSYVHGTLEVTGLEGSDLAVELGQLRVAKAQFRYTSGFQVYTLESLPDGDLTLLANARRDGLFLT